MSNYIIHEGILEKYEGSESTIEIPSGVEEIGVGAFRENSSIVNVIIPASVKSIKPTAFRECTNLEEVTFSDGLEIIGAAAFYYCQSLKTVILPNTVKTIGTTAFGSCSSLEKVVLSAGVKIEILGGKVRPFDGVFNGCSSLKSVGPLNSGCNIEYGWENSIPFCAFYGSEVSEVIISDTIKDIHSLAFRHCGKRMNAILPSSCDLGEDVFDDDASVRFSAPISSKDKISVNLAAYANGEFFNNLTAEEIAWIILYQSKKWKTAALNNIKDQRALDVLEKCYEILKDAKKITKAMGTTLVDILNEASNDVSYIDAAKDLKEFLLQKKCNDAADLISIDSKQEGSGDQKLENAGQFKADLGDEIPFGMYPQEKPSEPTPIIWIVLAKEGNSVFLVSKDSLAIRKYHEVRKKVSWAKSDLRQWLNDTFLQEAFSEKEQALIETVKKDKVTLLTKDDIKKYFTDIKQIAPKLTEYACAADPKKTPDSPCAWWLRLPVGSESKAPFVWGINLDRVEVSGTDFSQYMDTDYQVNFEFAVRPAIWISVK